VTLATTGQPARKKKSFEGLATIGMNLTDTGNAERLVARFRDQIRYCPPRKLWMLWDGRRWSWDRKSEIEQRAKQTVRAIFAEAEHAKDHEHAEAIAKHALHSEKRERRGAMVALAQSEPGIPVLPNELDSDPWSFNVANGTLDLRTGRLRLHCREDLITKLSPVDYEPGARSELWDRYLVDATGGDAELSAYLQRAVGYALQGQVTEKAFWFLYGPPDGMKSTFIDSVSAALGEYAVHAASGTWLVQTNTGGNRGDLVALLGARLVTSVEVRKGARFDEEIVKKITGGDQIAAAAKYESEITFVPTFSLWLAANDAPIIRDDDEGAWNRVRRIPFTHPLAVEKRDPNMREKLRAPAVQRAILAWAVEGCLTWQRQGVGTCEAVDASTAEYREDMDRVAGFFAERCVLEPDAKVANKELREAYETWCRENGVRAPLSGKEFASRLDAKHCAKAKSGSARGWRGIRLLNEWEEPQEQRRNRDGGTAGQTNPGNFPSNSIVEKFTGKACPAVPVVPIDDLDMLERAAVEAEGRGELLAAVTASRQQPENDG
jgi:putative DNA primase/helicase